MWRIGRGALAIRQPTRAEKALLKYAYVWYKVDSLYAGLMPAMIKCDLGSFGSCTKSIESYMHIAYFHP